MPVPITGMAVSQGLTEAFNLAGKLPLSLDEVVVPVVIVGALDDAVWGPSAIGQLLVPAAVGFQSEIELSLPQTISGQGAAAIIDEIQLVAGANQRILIGPSPGMPAPTHFGEVLWTDVGLRGFPTMAINGKNDAAAAPGLAIGASVSAVANTTREIPLEWILREFPESGLQQGLMIRPVAVNEEIRINVRWRERVPR